MTKSNVTFVCSLLAVATTLTIYWIGGDNALSSYQAPLLGRLLLVVATLLLAMVGVRYIYTEVVARQSDTALSPALFLLFSVGVPTISYTQPIAMCALPLFLLSQWLLLKSYQQSDIERKVVVLSFLMGLSTLFMPLLVLYFPLLWLGMYLCRCFTFRVWVASLLGMVTTYWINFGLSVVGVDMFPFALFQQMLFDISFVQIDKLDMQLTVYVSVLSALSVISMIYNTFRNSYNRVQTRIMCGYINYLCFYSLLLTLLYSSYVSTFIPVLISCTAIQVAHSLRRLAGRYASIILLLLFVLFIHLFIWSF